MTDRSILNKIKGDLSNWKRSGSNKFYQRDDPRRTFVTNLNKKDYKRIVSYAKIVNDFGLDYEFQAAAFDINGNQHDYMISFHLKGPHSVKTKSQIIDLMIKVHKKW